MKFADIAAGDVYDAGPYAVGEDEILAFARAFDPQWFHADPDAAARGRFELMPMGIHWPELDEDLGIAGMLQGRPGA